MLIYCLVTVGCRFFLMCLEQIRKGFVVLLGGQCEEHHHQVLLKKFSHGMKVIIPYACFVFCFCFCTVTCPILVQESRVLIGQSRDLLVL